MAEILAKFAEIAKITKESKKIAKMPYS